MIKNILYLSAFTLFFSSCNGQENTKIEKEFGIQKRFDIEKLHFYKPTQNLKLVVFTPSLYIDCEYASMLTNSLNYYFVQGLAFTKTPKPKIDVILVVNDSNKWVKDTVNDSFYFQERKNQNLLDGMIVNYDEKGLIFESLGIDPFEDSKIEIQKKDSIRAPFLLGQLPVELSRNESSKLFLLDENNNILLEDTDYRSQGEHLKPLENAVKQHLNIKVAIESSNYKKLKIGDKAPDIMSRVDSVTYYKESILNKDEVNIIKDTTSLKIITFYPAAFSGTLTDFTREDNFRLISCAVQIPSFDNPYGKDVITYAISSSKRELLDLWRITLRTSHIGYLNDEDYSISKKYRAYNLKGFNNRVTYLIDKKGIIQYIDYDYALEDQETLQQEIKKYL